jgi:hypothetical protein
VSNTSTCICSHADNRAAALLFLHLSLTSHCLCSFEDLRNDLLDTKIFWALNEDQHCRMCHRLASLRMCTKDEGFGRAAEVGDVWMMQRYEEEGLVYPIDNEEEQEPQEVVWRATQKTSRPTVVSGGVGSANNTAKPLPFGSVVVNPSKPVVWKTGYPQYQVPILSRPLSAASNEHGKAPPMLTIFNIHRQGPTTRSSSYSSSTNGISTPPTPRGTPVLKTSRPYQPPTPATSYASPLRSFHEHPSSSNGETFAPLKQQADNRIPELEAEIRSLLQQLKISKLEAKSWRSKFEDLVEGVKSLLVGMGFGMV